MATGTRIGKPEAQFITAYKYRRADQIGWILDIIFNKRLYCSAWNNQNDPSEGHYFLSVKAQGKLEDKEFRRRVAARLKEEKDKLRVCSLCKTFKNPLVWAHYADGFNGVAIEVKVQSADTADFDYAKTLPDKTEELANRKLNDSDFACLARSILSCKLKKWKAEQEVRILHEQEFYEPIEVSSVIVGPRVCDQVRKALKIICESGGTKLQLAKVSKGKISRVTP